jgi:hypothetical protein
MMISYSVFGNLASLQEWKDVPSGAPFCHAWRASFCQSQSQSPPVYEHQQIHWDSTSEIQTFRIHRGSLAKDSTGRADRCRTEPTDLRTGWRAWGHTRQTGGRVADAEVVDDAGTRETAMMGCRDTSLADNRCGGPGRLGRGRSELAGHRSNRITATE